MIAAADLNSLMVTTPMSPIDEPWAKNLTVSSSLSRLSGDVNNIINETSLGRLISSPGCWSPRGRGSAQIASCHLSNNYQLDNSSLVWNDVILWTAFTLDTTLSNAMLLGIIHYEWYGGDPQKRSVGNRLISSAAIACLLESSFRQIAIVLLRYGLANEMVLEILFFFFLTFLQPAFWFINIHTALRYLQVKVWKRAREINEDVAMRIIVFSVYGMCACLAFITRFDPDLYSAMAAFWQAEKVQMPLQHCLDNQDPFTFRLVMSVTIVLTLAWNVFAMVHMSLWETGAGPEGGAATAAAMANPAIIHDNDRREVRANRWRYNPSLFSISALPFLAFFLAVAIALVAHLLWEGMDIVKGKYIVSVTVSPLLLSVAVPLTFFLRHAEARKHIKRVLTNTHTVWDPVYDIAL